MNTTHVYCKGFGKRKSKSNVRGEFDPFFVSWIPKNVDRQAFVDDPKISAYAEVYNRDSTSSQTLSDVQSKELSNEQTNQTNVTPALDTSVYATAYRHGQPDQQKSKQIRNETFQRFLTTRTRLAERKSHDRSASVASCLVWNPFRIENNTRKSSTSNDTMIQIAVPVTLQSRVNSEPSSVQQRVQSAGPRLVSLPISSPPIPSSFIKEENQASSVQTLTTPTVTMKRPHTAMTTSREHYQGGNFSLKQQVPSRATSSFEPRHINSMDSLISKYM
jgi:hypothetical protein